MTQAILASDGHGSGETSSLVDAWQAYQAGKSAAEHRLLADLRPRILGLAKKYLGPAGHHEDVAQSVLVSFLANHAAKLPLIGQAGELWDLFAAITLRHCSKHNKCRYRANQRGPVLALQVGTGDSAYDLDPAAAELPPDEEAAIRDLFAGCQTRLTDRQQAVLVGTLAGEQRKDLASQLQVAIPTIDRELRSIRIVLGRLAGSDAE
jgi:DNA-directed RNA polymerase specialized sigma24 family protein